MRIMITGNEGFIAQHLERELQDAGHQTSGMDILRRENAGNADHVRSAIEGHRADVVIHLAAMTGRISGEDDVMETVRDHAGMTAVVAKACGELDVRMVYASTSEIYGDNGQSHCDEIKGPFRIPNSTYGLSKRFGEELCQLYAPDGFTALRFSMPYGPGARAGRDGSAIVNLLWQAKYGMTMPVHVGAERSWCWIGDAVRAARLAVEKGEGPFNIGRDDDASLMSTVAEFACLLTGSDKGLIEMIRAPFRQTLVKRISTKRIGQLGWSPTVSLWDGMSMTLEMWINHLDREGLYTDPGMVVQG